MTRCAARRSLWSCTLLVLAAGTASAQTTTLIAAASDRSRTDTAAGKSISADGRFIAFDSFANALVPGWPNDQRNVFVLDRSSGAIEWISSAGGGRANGNSSVGQISPDGRFVVFSSAASNLVAGDTNGQGDVFIHDRATGTTERVSIASDGTQGDGDSGTSWSAVSADGRFVVFLSYATNLVPGDTNLDPDIFLHDRSTGSTVRASILPNGQQFPQYSHLWAPAISADGRVIAFCGDIPQQGTRVLLFNPATGQTAALPTPLSSCNGLDLSLDGSFLAITASLLSDSTGLDRIFIYSRQSSQLWEASTASDGTSAMGQSYGGRISSDGGSVVFYSYAANLTANDTNSQPDIFLHVNSTGQTTRVSVAFDGAQANNLSIYPALSGDGSVIGFNSSATNLIPGGTDGFVDVFVRDLGAPPAGSPTLFQFSSIASPQQAAAAFPITLTAVDSTGHVVDYNSTATLSTNVGAVDPKWVQFEHGHAFVLATLDSNGTRLQLAALGAGASGASVFFDVAGGASSTGALAGLVSHGDGSPSAGATVSLLQNGSAVSSATTDSTGAFGFSGVPCGQYSTMAVATGGETTPVVAAPVQCGSTLTRNLTLYSGTCNAGAVTPVLLIPGILGSTFCPDGVIPRLPAYQPAWDDPGWSEGCGIGGFLFPAGLHDPLGQVGWGSLSGALQAANSFYQPNCTIFTVPFDWRIPIDQAVTSYLIPAIDHALALSNGAKTKVNIVAHSLGGLLVRAYLQSAGYGNDINKLALVGPPNLGTGKAYYMWQGADPVMADAVDVALSSSWYASLLKTAVLFEDTSDELFASMFGREPADWETVFRSGQSTAAYRNDIAMLYHAQVPSLQQLLPLWPVLSPNGALQCSASGSTGWTNSWLAQLNTAPERTRMGHVSDASGVVRTEIFAGTGQHTLSTIGVAPRACSSSYYPDGQPTGSYTTALADGTVSPESAFGGALTDPTALGAQVDYFTPLRSAEHSGLISAYQSDLVSFLIGEEPVPAIAKTATVPLTAAAAAPVLSLRVVGRPQPYLVGPGGQGAGINPGTGQREAALPGSSVAMQTASGAIAVSNPSAGSYSLTLSDSLKEDYLLYVSYLGTASSMSISAHGYLSRPLTLPVLFDPAAASPVTLGLSPYPPAGLAANIKAGPALATELSWIPSADPKVTSYNVYSKVENQLSLTKLGSTLESTFAPGDLWSQDSSVAAHVYAVSAVYADGTEGFLSDTVLNRSQPSAFYTVNPCRVADTRDPSGPYGGPALNAGSVRQFLISGRCNIPPTAKAISINVTVTGATQAGFLTLYPGGSLPATSTLNYVPGQTRANSAQTQLGSDGSLSVYCGQAAGQSHVIIDVNGYFQ